jgi:hypothetical protein
MKVIKENFTVLPDNDVTYFCYLEALVESVDELAEMVIIKNPDKYSFRISLSSPVYSQILLEEITKFHTMVSIRIDMSKSIKKNSTIFFTLKTNI